MIAKTAIAVFAVCAIAMGGAWIAPTPVFAQGKNTTVIDLSAQTNNNKYKKGGKKTVGKKTTPKKFSGQKTGGKKFTGSKTTTKTYTGNKSYTGKKSYTGNKNFTGTKKYTGTKTYTGTKKYTGTKTYTGTKKYTGTKSNPHKYGNKYNKPKTTVHVIKPTGSHSKMVTTRRLRGVSASGFGRAYVRGHNFSTWRHGRYRRRYHNAWITFVPLSVLAAILIDDRQYYAYAYLDAPTDYCYGRTEDGCQLVWDQIETLEGELVGQCVAYCPWRD